MMMNYARSEFHVVKNKIFNIVDSLRDSQRVIQTTEEYFGGNAVKYMEKRISSDKWKYQLKYSTKLTKRCGYDAEKVAGFADTIDASNVLIAKKMALV